MAELKKYTSFQALKSDEMCSPVKDKVFSEFEAFLRQLQSEYTFKKKHKKDNGKQPNR